MPRRYYRRQSRSSDFDLAVTIVVVAGALLWTHQVWIAYAWYTLAFVVAIGIGAYCFNRYKQQRSNSRLATLAEIDVMDGLRFEQLIANLLRKQGYEKVALTERYDYGVDIIAEKNSERWGIQVKRYTGLVKAAAVRQVVAALRQYNCSRAMVITNSTYSRVARQLAKSNNCVLVDRMELAELLEGVDESEG